VIKAAGYLAKTPEWQGTLYRPLSLHKDKVDVHLQVSLTGIPYYSWGNRMPSAMRVWMPLLDKM